MNVASLREVVGLLAIGPVMAWGAPEVAPTLDYGPLGTNSVVYCPTLLLAWTEVKGIVGGPVQMVDPDPLLGILNDGCCPSNTVPPDACVAMAGRLDEGIVQRLEKALRTRFGTASPAVPQDFGTMNTAFLAYAHLQRTLPFPRKFVRATNTPLPFQSPNGVAMVHCFGASAASAGEYSDQVRILHCEGVDDFSVQLATRIDGEFIVLAKIAAPATLREGSERVRTLIEGERIDSAGAVGSDVRVRPIDELSQGDVLIVPHVTLAVTASFDRLCGRPLLNDGFANAHIIRAVQRTAFSMDEAGATVRSSAYATFGVERMTPTPRRFVFDKPFLLTVWRKGAPEPYLALWVATPDVLLPFKAKTTPTSAVNRR